MPKIPERFSMIGDIDEESGQIPEMGILSPETKEPDTDLEMVESEKFNVDEEKINKLFNQLSARFAVLKAKRPAGEEKLTWKKAAEQDLEFSEMYNLWQKQKVMLQIKSREINWVEANKKIKQIEINAEKNVEAIQDNFEKEREKSLFDLAKNIYKTSLEAGIGSEVLGELKKRFEKELVKYYLQFTKVKEDIKGYEVEIENINKDLENKQKAPGVKKLEELTGLLRKSYDEKEKLTSLLSTACVLTGDVFDYNKKGRNVDGILKAIEYMAGVTANHDDLRTAIPLQGERYSPKQKENLFPDDENDVVEEIKPEEVYPIEDSEEVPPPLPSENTPMEVVGVSNKNKNKEKGWFGRAGKWLSRAAAILAVTFGASRELGDKQLPLEKIKEENVPAQVGIGQEESFDGSEKLLNASPETFVQGGIKPKSGTGGGIPKRMEAKPPVKLTKIDKQSSGEVEVRRTGLKRVVEPVVFEAPPIRRSPFARGEQKYAETSGTIPADQAPEGALVVRKSSEPPIPGFNPATKLPDNKSLADRK